MWEMNSIPGDTGAHVGSELPVTGSDQVAVTLGLPSDAQRTRPACRLWQHVTRALREGDQHKATQEKCALEEAQRQRTRERQQSLTPWTPRLFRLDPATQEWRYRHEK